MSYQQCHGKPITHNTQIHGPDLQTEKSFSKARLKKNHSTCCSCERQWRMECGFPNNEEQRRRSISWPESEPKAWAVCFLYTKQYLFFTAPLFLLHHKESILFARSPIDQRKWLFPLCLSSKNARNCSLGVS